MKPIDKEDSSYKTFQDLLTSYRLNRVMMTAFTAGVFDIAGDSGSSGKEICVQAGWEEKAGLRFLAALCAVGLFESKNGLFFPSQFSKRFLMKSSGDFKGASLEFEERLMESWGLLDQTLVQGKRIYGTDNKTPQEYHRTLNVYLDAMNDAARVRASELWDQVVPGKRGVILDVGAGSGAFLVKFLKKHPGWSGVFCDLKEVADKARSSKEVEALRDRIEFIHCNLLEKRTDSPFKRIKADYILYSNLVHCQGEKETMGIFKLTLPALAGKGLVLVHDFFSDCGLTGAMYDLHMMLNTFNGKVYKTSEISFMLKELGFSHNKLLQLPSGSTLLLASKHGFQ